VTSTSPLNDRSRDSSPELSAGGTTSTWQNCRSAARKFYLELSERDEEGRVLAKALGTIWLRTAQRILADRERVTGAQLAPGIKLLVLAKPNVKPQYGMSIDITGIDPSYTIGDLEAQKRQIREELLAEQLFDRNKKLPAPWDFSRVLVVSLRTPPAWVTSWRKFRTLGRGFAIVKASDGKKVTSAAAARDSGAVTVSFKDGDVAAQVRGSAGKEPPGEKNGRLRPPPSSKPMEFSSGTRRRCGRSRSRTSTTCCPSSKSP
jgi:exonuclease VII large subunit